jgi:very-short-patch-repair endonuclease
MRTTDITLKRARRLRDSMTRQELGLWLRLKNRQLGGFKFRRQHPVGPYILDFYCPEARLAVEIDGDVHNHPNQIEHDRRRDAFFRERGVKTLRLGLTLARSPGQAADHILDVLRRG